MKGLLFCLFLHLLGQGVLFTSAFHTLGTTLPCDLMGADPSQDSFVVSAACARSNDSLSVELQFAIVKEPFSLSMNYGYITTKGCVVNPKSTPASYPSTYQNLNLTMLFYGAQTGYTYTPSNYVIFGYAYMTSGATVGPSTFTLMFPDNKGRAKHGSLILSLVYDNYRQTE